MVQAKYVISIAQRLNLGLFSEQVGLFSEQVELIFQA